MEFQNDDGVTLKLSTLAVCVSCLQDIEARMKRKQFVYFEEADCVIRWLYVLGKHDAVKRFHNIELNMDNRTIVGMTHSSTTLKVL